MAVVLPTLGSIGEIYGVGYSMAQFVVSAYLFGLGITQPFSGLLCDRIGRRPVMLWGTALFALASVGCAVAHDLWLLVALRFVQAIGISVGTVASRAIIRDTCDPLDSARALSRLAAGMGVAPVLAPIIGGALAAGFGPAGVFMLCALLAVGMLAWLVPALVETHAPAPRGPGDRPWWAGYGELLASRPFVSNTLLYAFIQGAFFSFLAVGATVFRDDLGLGPQYFGMVWGLMGIAYVASAAGAGRLAARIGVQGVLRIGALTTLGAGWGMVLLTGALGVHLATLVGPLLGLMIASGFVQPMAMAGAVGGRPELAGTAAGLSGAAALVLGGSFSIASGFVFKGPFTPIALLMAVAATLTAAMYPLTRARA